MTRTFPQMPPIGRPESFYSKLAHDADKMGDIHAHEAAKVGQYITLALDPALPWGDKQKYFRHAIKRHCQPPLFPDDDVWVFYKTLADLVRQHCGAEALRLMSREDDMYAARLSMGQERSMLENEAEEFFGKIMGAEEKPDWFLETDWEQMRLIRDQWI